MENKPLLGLVLSELSRNFLQVKLLIGHQDSQGGYGWHSVYQVEVIETIEYCPLCRDKTGLNYSDYAHNSNHQHRHEYKTIFFGRFHDTETMCQELLKLKYGKLL